MSCLDLNYETVHQRKKLANAYILEAKSSVVLNKTRCINANKPRCSDGNVYRSV